jgi:hypothetical protein
MSTVTTWLLPFVFSSQNDLRRAIYLQLIRRVLHLWRNEGDKYGNFTLKMEAATSSET